MSVIVDVKKIERPASLSEIAYEAIKKSLLQMDLSAIEDEQRIDERTLAEKLGISRTPVREAINRLVIEGYLKVVPRKGVFVVKKSKKEIIEILLVRSVLEGLAAKLATEHVTGEEIERMKDIFAPFNSRNIKRKFLEYAEANIRFHELVIQISQCGKLIELAGSIFDHMRWIRFQSVVHEDRLIKSHREHLKRIEALEKRDANLAERLMKKHIEELAFYEQMENTNELVKLANS